MLQQQIEKIEKLFSQLYSQHKEVMQHAQIAAINKDKQRKTWINMMKNTTEVLKMFRNKMQPGLGMKKKKLRDL